MQNQENIFEKTYNDYLEQIRGVSFGSTAPRLGLVSEETKITIPLLNNDYHVSPEGITDRSGKKPSHDICVILCKYILLCPVTAPKEHDLVSFRNFQDSNPLINYFSNEVEGAVGSCFSGRLSELQRASDKIGGHPAGVQLSCDLALEFDALPKIPIFMLCNDADEDFPAKCSVLFERNAESYLDAECIAMLGRQLVLHLLTTLPPT